jgi:hypothetical protein
MGNTQENSTTSSRQYISNHNGDAKITLMRCEEEFFNLIFRE